MNVIKKIILRFMYKSSLFINDFNPEAQKYAQVSYLFSNFLHNYWNKYLYELHFI